MEYVDKLLQNTDYLKQLKRLEQLEQGRQFCCHGITHLLDTARIAWIYSLEHSYALEKEMVYLTALLHDLGRITEYEKGVPHHLAGQEIAENLLRQIGYSKEKTRLIAEAIGNHRKGHKAQRKDQEQKMDMDTKPENSVLAELLFRADKQSRNCFVCQVQKECKWSCEKQNQTIRY